jgi:hypothetical protein
MGDLVVLWYAEGEEAAYRASNRAILEQAAILGEQAQQAAAQ